MFIRAGKTVLRACRAAAGTHNTGSHLVSQCWPRSHGGPGDTGNASCLSLMHGPPDLRSRLPPLHVGSCLLPQVCRAQRARNSRVLVRAERGDSLNTKFQPLLRSDYQANKAAAAS